MYVQSDHDHPDRLLPLGATGERTDLNRGESHAPIRSRSTVSGRRRRHNAGRSALGRHSESSQPPPPESAPLTGRHHDVENDIEFGYVPRASPLRARAFSYSAPVI